MGVTVSRLASGLPVGGDLEYADEVTLGRAFQGRRQLPPKDNGHVTSTAVRALPRAAGPIRLIASDLDGTLLHGHSNVTPRTAASAIRAAFTAGIEVIAATGRQYLQLPGRGHRHRRPARGGQQRRDRGRPGRPARALRGSADARRDGRCGVAT